MSYTYNNGTITQNGREPNLYGLSGSVTTADFTVITGNLPQVVVKYGDDTTILTQTITYDAGGNLASITKDYA